MLTREETLRTYRSYAPAYDLIFGSVFRDGRQLAVSLASDKPYQEILEVGVGTGLSMPFYRKDVRLTGIDISEEMLVQARRRAARLGHDRDWRIEVMDVQAMDFPDASFDRVVALYVASTVQHLKAFGQELRRVCRPGGEIIIVNHFTSRNRTLAAIEKLLGHYAGRLGFEPDFPLDRFTADTGIVPDEILPTGLFGYWQLLRMVKAG